MQCRRSSASLFLTIVMRAAQYSITSRNAEYELREHGSKVGWDMRGKTVPKTGDTAESCSGAAQRIVREFQKNRARENHR